MQQVTAADLKALSKKQCLDFIRNKLAFKENTTITEMPTASVFGGNEMPIYETSTHRTFDMSGYDGDVGSCTLHNLAILNEFAYLGIYDYTAYLFLDFYKGTPTVYLSYFHVRENVEEEFIGFTTSEIIYEIFTLTIFSKERKRRR